VTKKATKHDPDALARRTLQGGRTHVQKGSCKLTSLVQALQKWGTVQGIRAKVGFKLTFSGGPQNRKATEILSNNGIEDRVNLCGLRNPNGAFALLEDETMLLQ
jgi:hypothetical protein